ncbi:DNA cytosine methyltransferase [Nocardia arizonensis]|uniref:DNA cytosine methyltransferase n=1 Tax=Nocardia arizonensis TaxID=1141647 RepID=UPI000AE2D4BF|nr:DNA cytosine methyltransferase [Nocardia arizonensis]
MSDIPTPNPSIPEPEPSPQRGGATIPESGPSETIPHTDGSVRGAAAMNHTSPARFHSTALPAGLRALTRRQPCQQPSEPAPLKVAELYAGIGGFSLGFETLGASTVFASESNPAARKTFEANFHHRYPGMFGDGQFVGDIGTVAAEDLPKYDVLTAGFPCQPFSEAGVRRGFTDTRGTAFFDVVRILEATRPPAFFLENVRGLLTHGGGQTIAVMKALLTDHLGYTLHLKVLRACDFGLPQLRPRLFMVGFRRRSTPFSFPEPVPLVITMDDIVGGDCHRKIGWSVLASGYNKPFGVDFGWSHYLVDGVVRQLGIAEIRRMQGFPDDFVFPVSDAQALRQLGNAVAVAPVAATAREIARALGRLRPDVPATRDQRDRTQ